MTERDFSDAEKKAQMERQVMALPLKFCDAIIIGRPPAHAGDLGTRVLSASVTYLQLNGRKMVVTNAHVIRIFEKEHAADGVTIIQLQGLEMGDIHARIIDIDDDADLVTLDVSDLELVPRDVPEREDLCFRQFYVPATWPPAEVNEGDVVAFAGWPEVLRKDNPNGWDVESNPYSMIGMEVRRVSPDQFTVRINREDTKIAFGRTAFDEKDYCLSGMSGGPVLRRNQLSYELVGVIKEYQPPPYDLFAFATVNSIKTTGELWHNTRR